MGGDGQLLLAVFTFMGVVVTALTGVIVALINSRRGRVKIESDPDPDASPFTQIAVVTNLQDRALRDLDRRMLAVERHLDDRDSDWRE
jgi:hypothetical protein